MSADMPAGATVALTETQRLIDKCQKEIRAISYLMHPPMLGEAGLVSALRWFIEGFMERTGIRVDLDIGPDPGRLPPDVETALFRVAQEALANVHRHSGSASASIRLHRRRTPGAEDCVVLAITDEGRGLPPDVAGAFASGTRRAAARVGVGLLGMDERLRQIGGRLRIRSRGTGATIRAVVPLGTRVIE
jgi:signal transduction histidine kinase